MKFFKLFLLFISACLVVWVLVFYRNDTLRIFSDARACFGNLFSETQIEDKVVKLTLENEKLIAELNALRRVSGEELKSFEFKVAHIYSRYPFNNRASLILDLGSDAGIQPGMPVLAGEGVLLGRVKTVRQMQSEVETIFSSAWKSSVGIGDKKVKAVLSGGTTPMLEFIAKEEKLKEGDRVFNLSPELPLNLYIGTLSNVVGVSYDVWQKGELNTLYEPENLDTALVVVNFP